MKKLVEKFVRKWVEKRPGIVIGWLARSIVRHMMNAKIGYAHINKWLKSINHPQICGYMMLPGQSQPMVYFKAPTIEERKNLPGRYVPIIPE